MAISEYTISVDQLLQTEAIGTSAAGTAVAVGKKKRIGVAVDGVGYIAFGAGAAPTAAATDILLPGPGFFTFDMGQNYTHIELFNPSGSATLNSSVVLLTNS